MGFATVTTAGTPVRLHSTSIRARRVVIYAPKANSGQLIIGGSSNFNAGAGVGSGLDAGESITLETDKNFLDLYDIWLDTTADGDKADFFAQKV
jgi:hypothetical protein